MIDFRTLTISELSSIWESTNGYEWNDLLGTKPEGFDDLPATKRRWQFWIRRTKRDYTAPIWRIVDAMLKERTQSQEPFTHS